MRREAIGVIGATLAFVGIATFSAFQTPPFLAPDEKAHLGYAHEVAAGRLPEIETEQVVPASATQWQAELDSAADHRYRSVWVANHPPLHYVLAAPLIWLSDATDRADGGLLFMRLANLALAGAGIAMTYLFATQASGGARRIGLAAAGLIAFLPQAHGRFSEGLNDGLAFAASATLMWAAARCLRAGTTRRNVIFLGAGAAAAAGARASTMLLAVAVVGFVAIVEVCRRGPLGARMRNALRVAAIGLGPSIVLWGWFYVRNIHLYGDPGASSFLLDLFQRSAEGSILDVATRGEMWTDVSHMLLSPSASVSAINPPPGLHLAVVVSVVGLGCALIVGRTGDRSANDRSWTISRRSLALGLVATAVVAITVAQHVSGGGNAYARYLFPALPVMATCCAIGFDRLVPRVLPALAVGALVFWAWRNIPMSNDASTFTRLRDRGRGMPAALRELPSTEVGRVLFLLFAVVGTALVAVVVLLGVLRRRPGPSTITDSTRKPSTRQRSRRTLPGTSRAASEHSQATTSATSGGVATWTRSGD